MYWFIVRCCCTIITGYALSSLACTSTASLFSHGTANLSSISTASLSLSVSLTTTSTACLSSTSLNATSTPWITSVPAHPSKAPSSITSSVTTSFSATNKSTASCSSPDLLASCTLSFSTTTATSNTSLSSIAIHPHTNIANPSVTPSLTTTIRPRYIRIGVTTFSNRCQGLGLLLSLSIDIVSVLHVFPPTT